MRFPFVELPGADGGYLRPVVNVLVDGLPDAPLACLLDSGALHNRFGRWVAEMAGIDLAEAEGSEIGLGGFATTALTVPVELRIDSITWRVPVSFCEPWPLGFQILGQEGFFRWFRVLIRAAVYTVELELEDV